MKVLLAVDFSPATDRTIQTVREYKWPPATVVRVLAVVERIPPSAAELFYDADGDLDNVLAARKQRAEELVQKVAAELQKQGLRTETAVRTGRRRKSTAQEAQLWTADFILDAGQAWDRDRLARKIGTGEA